MLSVIFQAKGPLNRREVLYVKSWLFKTWGVAYIVIRTTALTKKTKYHLLPYYYVPCK